MNKCEYGLNGHRQDRKQQFGHTSVLFTNTK
jgi:hypothetical protein